MLGGSSAVSHHAVSTNSALTFSGLRTAADYQRVVQAVTDKGVAITASTKHEIDQGETRLDLALPEGLTLQELVKGLRDQGIAVL